MTGIAGLAAGGSWAAGFAAECGGDVGTATPVPCRNRIPGEFVTISVTENEPAASSNLTTAPFPKGPARTNPNSKYGTSTQSGEAGRGFLRGLLLQASCSCLFRSGLRSRGLHEDWSSAHNLAITPDGSFGGKHIRASDISSQFVSLVPKGRGRNEPKGLPSIIIWWYVGYAVWTDLAAWRRSFAAH